MTDKTSLRTHYAGKVGANLNGKDVTLAGWVHEIRDLGKLKFMIIRDLTGKIQVTAKKETTGEDVLSVMNSISRESVVQVFGTVIKNEKAPGGCEVIPKSIIVIAASNSPLPLDPIEKVPADLDTRLNNRFMDVRKPTV